MLLSALRERWDGSSNHTIVAMAADACYLDGAQVELSELAAELDAGVENAGVDARRDRITFLSGKRAQVEAGLLEALAAKLETASTRT